ncbi:MAG: DUF2069 domain-containing protein [Burkholderiaceae bacterium]
MSTATEAPANEAPGSPSPALGRAILFLVLALAVFCVAWETWLAPIRPGAWMLALKSLPLWLVLGGLANRRMRSFQWLSLLILAYLAEGLVRATSDIGAGRPLGWIEAGLSLIIFLAVLRYCAQGRPRKPAG